MADKFPESLPGFQKMFPDDNACALYLESIRWRDGFVCPRCASTAAPTRIAKPGVLRCKGELTKHYKTLAARARSKRRTRAA